MWSAQNCLHFCKHTTQLYVKKKLQLLPSRLLFFGWGVESSGHWIREKTDPEDHNFCVCWNIEETPMLYVAYSWKLKSYIRLQLQKLEDKDQ
jgi:hypothetical protein